MSSAGGDAERGSESRRSFLVKAGIGTAAAWTAPLVLSSPARAAGSETPPSSSSSSTTSSVPPPPSPLLDVPASEAPIDHIVILMLENRSFDHWLGWLAEDGAYLAAGQSRYGGGFTINGAQHQTYSGPGGLTPTAHLLELLATGNPYRGCDHPDPGHGWNAGRAQRDGGFLAPGSGNDQFATGYYLGDDVPFSALLAKRFSVCDRSHASVLGPTYPNREYLLAAQSGGNKSNAFPPTGGFTWDTIVDRLVAAGVSVRSYFADLPMLALWGSRMASIVSVIDNYFADCAAGTLPSVSFIDPGFLSGSRTDNHPHGDIRAGERFARDVFAAFARSPHWERGTFILTYDEWGGFFDHVAPPILPDDRASAVDQDNFGQAGFRVPTVVASPYAQPGFVDHRLYDHTSILRFLEWRFLGAPPEGPGGGAWSLTTRDRNANNIGASLVTTPTTDIGMDLDVAIGSPSAACPGEEGGGLLVAGSAPSIDAKPVSAPVEDKHSLELARDAGVFEAAGFTSAPSSMVSQWLVE